MTGRGPGPRGQHQGLGGRHGHRPQVTKRGVAPGQAEPSGWGRAHGEPGGASRTHGSCDSTEHMTSPKSWTHTAHRHLWAQPLFQAKAAHARQERGTQLPAAVGCPLGIPAYWGIEGGERAARVGGKDRKARMVTRRCCQPRRGWEGRSPAAEATPSQAAWSSGWLRQDHKGLAMSARRGTSLKATPG